MPLCRRCGSEFKKRPDRNPRFCSGDCRRSMTVVDWFFYYGWKISDANCWEWQRSFCPVGGYGDVRSKGRTYKAHRVSWEFFKSPLQSGELVLHRCDNRVCVNPDHLFIGDDAANVADMDAKNRRRPLPGIMNGWAKLSEKQVLEIRKTSEYGSGARLARKFGVSPSCASLIRRGRAWRHV